MVFSTFAVGKFDKFSDATDWVAGHKKELGIGAGSFLTGVLLTYLANNSKVKSCAANTSSAVYNYTKAKYQAMVNYVKNLSRNQKIALGAAVGTGATAAYIVLDGPGAKLVKDKLGKAKTSTPPTTPS